MLVLRKSCVLALLFVWTTVSVPQAARHVHERQLKAATIVSMLRLVTWRGAAPPATIAVVVVGDDALADALREASSGARVDGRSLTVSRVPSLARLDDAAPSVVVLAAGQRAFAHALVRSYGGKPVLTIGEGDGMGEAGLVIGVYVDGERIRFDANTGAASRAGLSLSSHLLRLARIVG